jgi:hypothetical protein
MIGLVKFGGACAGLLVLCQAAQANVIEISLDPGTHNPSDVPFNNIGGNPVSIFGWLQGEILSYANNKGVQLPDPTTGLIPFNDLGGHGLTIGVQAGDYIVEHYGVGPGGVPGTGGGLVAYYVDAAGTYTIPDNGPGPNGTGGISFAEVWDHTGTTGGGVPDGGMTWAMLGMGLGGVGLFSRANRKNRA